MDINEMRRKYREANSRKVETEKVSNQVVEPTTTSEQTYTPTPTIQPTANKVTKNYFVRHGECSDVSIDDARYNYVRGEHFVEFTMGRLQNDSPWRTGCLEVCCWISSCKFNWEDGWGDEEVNLLVGQQVIGDLEEGYGFPDVKCTFNLSDVSDEILNDYIWNFVFTINELSEDDKWLIIDYRNGETENGNDNDNDEIDTNNHTSAYYGNSSVFSRVKAIVIDKLGVEPYEVVEDASFMNDLGADSLDAVELIMEFEKEFGINIPDEIAERIRTVGDAVRLLEKNI